MRMVLQGERLRKRPVLPILPCLPARGAEGTQEGEDPALASAGRRSPGPEQVRSFSRRGDTWRQLAFVGVVELRCPSADEHHRQRVAKGTSHPDGSFEAEPSLSRAPVDSRRNSARPGARASRRDRGLAHQPRADGIARLSGVIDTHRPQSAIEVRSASRGSFFLPRTRSLLGGERITGSSWRECSPAIQRVIVSFRILCAAVAGRRG
mmetsp:Transcript_17788/g.50693  ORF Transcript_17788/g.50693 Transcript_17788/m.50693 type:complete len:208 (-) Transcript_17788:3-626(-)